MLYPQLVHVHVAQLSTMFIVWPVSNHCERFRVQSKGLSSSNAVSLSSW